jgi:hypothetical protein
MIAQRDGVILIECFVDFVTPRVRSAGRPHQPQNNPVDDQCQKPEHDNGR